MTINRKLAAVLAADIVGYSRLMAEAEQETLERLTACRGIFAEHVEEHGGRIFNTAGDAVLAELPSALAAAQCAISVQKALAAWNAPSPASRKMLFRMGITVGDVFDRDGDLLGDGVNIAARLQAMAAPGGICVSRWVQEQVDGKIDASFRDLGAQPVKNIPKPVHVFAIEHRGRPPPAAVPQHVPPRRRFVQVAAAVVAVLVALGTAAAWMLRVRPQPNVGQVAGREPAEVVVSVAPSAMVPDGKSQIQSTLGSRGGQPVASDPVVASAEPAAPARVPGPGTGPSYAPAPAPTPAEAESGASQQAGSVTPPDQGAERPDSGPQPAAAALPAAIVTPRQLKAGDIFRDCPSCPEMVVIPTGEFVMGSPGDEAGREIDEGPQRTVRIEVSLAVGRGAVTLAEFSEFVRDSGYRTASSCHVFEAGAWKLRNDRSLQGPGFPQTATDPVVCVSWQDAQAYAEWLSRRTRATYRLPSEAEREYFTRAGTTTVFWWGNEISPGHANYDATLSYAGSKTGEHRRGTRPVLDFEPSPWGLSQVHGNVAEWTEDCWNASHAQAPADGRARMTGDCARRVLRGGAWGYHPKELRAAYREALVADRRYYHIGFRVVRPAPSPGTAPGR